MTAHETDGQHDVEPGASIARVELGLWPRAKDGSAFRVQLNRTFSAGLAQFARALSKEREVVKIEAGGLDRELDRRPILETR